jgi:CHAT domain-containing protein
MAAVNDSGAGAVPQRAAASVDGDLDLPLAAARLREELSRLPEGHPDRPTVAAWLGTVLVTWFHHETNGPAGGHVARGERIDEAIGLLTKAQWDFRTGDPFRDELRYWLALGLFARFVWYGGDSSDADLAISEFEACLAQPALAAERVGVCHLHIAHLLLSRGAPAILRRATATLDGRQIGRLITSVSGPAPPDLRKALTHLDQVPQATDPQSPQPDLVRQLRAYANAALDPSAAARDNGFLAEMAGAFQSLPEDTPGAREMRGLLAMLQHGLPNPAAGGGMADGPAGPAPGAVLQPAGDPEPLAPGGAAGGAFGVPLGALTPEEAVAAAEVLQAMLASLPDDHQARLQVFARLVSLLFGQVARTGRLEPRLAKLRGELTEAVGRRPADTQDEALHLFLLGTLEGVDGYTRSDADLIGSAIKRLERGAETAAVPEWLRVLGRTILVLLFFQRHEVSGEIEYLDAAVRHAEQLMDAAEGDSASGQNQAFDAGRAKTFASVLLTAFPLVKHFDTLDGGKLGQIIGQLEALAGVFPGDAFLRSAVASSLGELRLLREAMSVDKAAGPFGVPDGPDIWAAARDPVRVAEINRAAGALLAKLGDATDGSTASAFDVGAAGNARVLQGFMLRDRQLLGEGIALLVKARTSLGTPAPYQSHLLMMIALAQRMRYVITGNRADLDSAITRLEEARRLCDDEVGMPDLADVLYFLGAGYHERGDRNLADRSRAVAAGLAALHERAAAVMLQTTPDHAFDAARDAGGEAAGVARWCLAAGDTTAAVTALERGRGMVLHAATADAEVAQVLREIGDEELATEWEVALREGERADPGPLDMLLRTDVSLRGPAGRAGAAAHRQAVQVPSDLRYRVLRSLAGTEVERLLAPPAVAEIGAALRRTGRRALVYLIPWDSGGPAFALIVDAEGQVRELALPSLISGPRGPVARFASAQRDLHASGVAGDGEARQRWRAALAALCDWAWPAVSAALAAVKGAPQERPRLVLVPVGDLGLVPWHAARRAVSGGVRYACQDAVISYAASARQFVDACHRPHRAWQSDPALVRVPEGRLYFATKEVRGIYDRHYRGGVLLGGSGGQQVRATAASVRALLPRRDCAGASLLHLGCHAEPASRPAGGRLLLQGGELTMRSILRQAHARPRDTPGCLIVLAACGTDLASEDHDEALTLATSFMAAGAVGVVGTRWPVHDVATLAVMTMFHHYLNGGYAEPAVALRAAAAWMLDPGRAFPGFLAAKTAELMTTVDLALPEHWAGFTYQGQ